MTRSIAVTFDYRCPFARNGHEAVVNALRDGADFDVRFIAVLARPGPRRGGRAAGVGARPGEWGTGHARAALRHRGPRPVPRPVPRRAPRAVRAAPRPRPEARPRGRARRRRSTRSASTPTPSRPRSGAAGRSKTLAAEHTEAVDTLGGVRRADLHRRRRGRVRPLHGARPRRRPRAGARPARVAGSTSSSAPESPADDEGRAVRMSPSEAMMWAVEKDPALRSDFCNITILDALPSERRLRDDGRARARRDPPARASGWSRRRCGSRRRSGGPTRPSTSTTTSAARAAPSPVDARAPRRRRHRDRAAARPVAAAVGVHLIEGLADGRAALLQRLHHTITDGVGGMRLSLSLVDLEREPAPHRDVHHARARGGRRRRSAATTRRRRPGRPRAHRSTWSATRSSIAAAQTIELARRARGRVRLDPDATDRDSRPGPRRRSSSCSRCAARCSSPAAAHSEMFAMRSLARRFDVLERRPRSPPARRQGSRRQRQRRLRHRRRRARSPGTTASSASAVETLRMAMPVSTRDRGDFAANRFAPSRVLVPVAIDVGRPIT